MIITSEYSSIVHTHYFGFTLEIIIYKFTIHLIHTVHSWCQLNIKHFKPKFRAHQIRPHQKKRTTNTIKVQISHFHIQIAFQKQFSVCCLNLCACNVSVYVCISVCMRCVSWFFFLLSCHFHSTTNVTRLPKRKISLSEYEASSF